MSDSQHAEGTDTLLASGNASQVGERELTVLISKESKVLV